jgi:hypothetical protein
VLQVLVAALAQHIEREDRALPGVDEVAVASLPEFPVFMGFPCRGLSVCTAVADLQFAALSQSPV